VRFFRSSRGHGPSGPMVNPHMMAWQIPQTHHVWVCIVSIIITTVYSKVSRDGTVDCRLMVGIRSRLYSPRKTANCLVVVRLMTRWWCVFIAFISLNELQFNYSFSVFSTQQHICSVRYMLLPIHPLSVTPVDQSEKVEIRIMKFSLYGSPIPLVVVGKFHPETSGFLP